MGKWGLPLLCAPIFLISVINGAAGGESVRLEMMHRHDDRLLGETPKPSKLERFKELVRIDGYRQSSWRRRGQEVGGGGPGTNPDGPHSGELRMGSAVDLGIAQYVVTIMVGTPPQRVSMLVDTGSDLTWVKCRPGGAHQPFHRPGLEFLPDESSSFRTVPCSSAMCKVSLSNMFSLTDCPTPTSPCAYHFSYMDGATSQGIFANETVTLDLINTTGRKLPHVLVGCSQSPGRGDFSAVGGLLGLGFSKFSFARRATLRFGGTYSYCLVDHMSPQNVSSYLTLGGGPGRCPAGGCRAGMQFINFRPHECGPLVNVTGISVDGKPLHIPPRVWDLVAGEIPLDSGTSLTFLEEPVYGAVAAALAPFLAGFPALELDIPGVTICFNASGFSEADAPKLAVHFDGGARLEPPPKSYLMDVGAGEARCLGIAPAVGQKRSIIGNIMQQNHLWEFDLIGKEIGFAPSSCT